VGERGFAAKKFRRPNRNAASPQHIAVSLWLTVFRPLILCEAMPHLPRRSLGLWLASSFTERPSLSAMCCGIAAFRSACWLKAA